jgi:hypothetical protein
MAATVSAADDAVSGLATDGEVIEETLDTHKYGLKNELKETNTALRKVKIAASREKWMIWGSLGFFTTVVVYIVTKRTRILTLLWLMATGTYHGGNILQDLFKGGQRGTSDIPSGVGVGTLMQQEELDVGVGTLMQQEELDVGVGTLMQQEELDVGVDTIVHKKDFEVNMEGYLEMEIDMDNYDVPMPPQQYGPLTREDHEVAEMYDAILRDK